MLDKLKKALGALKREAVPPKQVTDEFVRHLKRGDRVFQMNLDAVTIHALWDEALRVEPRLIYTITSYRTKDKGAYHDDSPPIYSITEYSDYSTPKKRLYAC